jgi:hydrogenase nickel incorporation protein HypA/HybF
VHELPVAESILDIALRHAGGKRIAAIDIAIGDLSTMVDEAIQQWWHILSEGTTASAATLRFRHIPGVLRCLQCAGEYPVATRDFICPACGAVRAKPVSGDTCSVESIEVED